MATGRETRSNPVPKFAVGEKVLCYEPDPNKARVLYESKVNFIERMVFMLVGELTDISDNSIACVTRLFKLGQNYISLNHVPCFVRNPWFYARRSD